MHTGVQKHIYTNSLSPMQTVCLPYTSRIHSLFAMASEYAKQTRYVRCVFSASTVVLHAFLPLRACVFLSVATVSLIGRSTLTPSPCIIPRRSRFAQSISHLINHPLTRPRSLAHLTPLARYDTAVPYLLPLLPIAAHQFARSRRQPLTLSINGTFARHSQRILPYSTE